jgi:methylenetetrahydrofolate dehydrogenase (NADP+)/methenyltetrahydrofolate cyclohydrolase
MSAQILDGKALSEKLKRSMSVEIEEMKRRSAVPGLAVILVGNDPASTVYVSNKTKDCAEVGIYSEKIYLPENTSEQELLQVIGELNARSDIHGILVQLPLPNHIDEKRVILSINEKKDVDAFHPVNVGKIMIGDFDFLPCTPAGVMEILDDAGIEISGKECVVIGRSNIVGKPMAMLMLHRSATVTVCHSRTKNLSEKVSRADIVIAAVGKANLITGDMIKKGAVVIDVGMNRLENGKLCGDVHFESAVKKAGFITPVPGGVGPMTRAILLKNTIKAAKLQLCK